MSDDQDGCEWGDVSSGTGLPGRVVPDKGRYMVVCVLSKITRKIPGLCKIITLVTLL